jgi:hypothetical protein
MVAGSARIPGLRAHALQRNQTEASRTSNADVTATEQVSFAQILQSMANQIFQTADMIAEQRSDLAGSQMALAAGGVQESEMGEYQAIVSRLASLPMPVSIEREGWSLEDAAQTRTEIGLIWRQDTVSYMNEPPLLDVPTATTDTFSQDVPVSGVSASGVSSSPAIDWDGVQRYGWGMT